MLTSTKKDEITFYFPIKYIINENLTDQGIKYNENLVNFDQDAKDIKDYTIQYLKIAGIDKDYSIESILYINSGKKYYKFTLKKKS